MSDTIKQEYSIPPGTKLKFDADGSRLIGIDVPRSKPRKTSISLSNSEGDCTHSINIMAKMSIDEIIEISKVLIQ